MSGLVLPGVTAEPAKKEHRLLVCYDCFTIEKLPPYRGATDDQGRYLEDDPPLEYLIESKHMTDGQEPHRGMLFLCDEDTWNSLNAQTEISKEVFKDQAANAQLRDSLTDDALSCYRKHNRPKDGCIDWMDESKRLPSPSKQKSANKGKHAMKLCHFCPVTHGTVLPDIRTKLGLRK